DLRAQARLLAAQLAQVVEARATHVAAALDLDLLDDRRVHREDALDADAVGDLAHREALRGAPAAAADDHALEYLDALLVALLHPHVDAHGVAGAEGRVVLAQGRALDAVESVHRSSSPRPAPSRSGRRRLVVSRACSARHRAIAA